MSTNWTKNLFLSQDWQRVGNPSGGGDVCTVGGSLTSWTEACWKRGIRGLVLGMSMWICREKERKKNRHWSNGQVSTDHGNSERHGLRVTVSESYPWLKVIGKRVLLWNGWQKWSGIWFYTLTCLRASQSVGCVCWTTVTPFQSVCSTDEQTWQSGRFVRREAGWMQYSSWSRASRNQPTRERAAFLLTGPCTPCPRSCLLCPPYLCHLWLQHQRLRSHPGNVYVDLTATWEKNALNTHMHTYFHTQCRRPSMHLYSKLKIFLCFDHTMW